MVSHPYWEMEVFSLVALLPSCCLPSRGVLTPTAVVCSWAPGPVSPAGWAWWVKTKSSPSYGTQEQHAQLCSQVSWFLQLHEVPAPGGSLPYLCFPCEVPSPVCNHTPVQRKAVLDNRELNTDSSCVGVKGASQTSGMMVQSISSLWHSSIGQGQGMCSPPLSPVPGVGVEAWNCLCLRLLAWVGGKAYYKNSEPSSSDDSRQCFLCRWW